MTRLLRFKARFTLIGSLRLLIFLGVVLLPLTTNATENNSFHHSHRHRIELTENSSDPDKPRDHFHILRKKSPLPLEATILTKPNKQPPRRDRKVYRKAPHGAAHHRVKQGASEKDFAIDFAGYAQEDYIGFANVPSQQPRFVWRSADAFIDIQLYKVFQVIAAYEFAHKELEFAAVAFTGIKHLALTAGQYFPWLGLSNNSSTNFITFMELALPVDAFAAPYSPGMSLAWFPDPFVFFIGWFGPPLTENGTVGRTPYGETAELAYVPIHTKTRMLQFSLSLWDQETDSARTADFSMYPELLTANEQTFVDTGNITNTYHYDVIDATGAFVRGPWSAQAEYYHAWVLRDAGLSTLNFSGYYATLSFFLTGESRIYGYHALGFIGMTGIRHHYGAWQLALRYSHLNLSSGNVRGGTENNMTVGLNWYINQHLELLLNYVHMQATPDSNGINRYGNLYGLRLQASLES